MKLDLELELEEEVLELKVEDIEGGFEEVCMSRSVRAIAA